MSQSIETLLSVNHLWTNDVYNNLTQPVQFSDHPFYTMDKNKDVVALRLLKSLWQNVSGANGIKDIIVTLTEVEGSNSECSANQLDALLLNLINAIDWYCIENNDLILGMALAALESDLCGQKILQKLDFVLFNHHGENSPFFRWLELYIVHHGDSEPLYIEWIVSIMKYLLQREPFLVGHSIMPILHKNIRCVERIMFDSCIFSWYNWFTGKFLDNRVIQFVAKFAHEIALRSPLVFMQVTASITSFTKLCEFLEKFEWKQFLEALLCSEQARPVATFLFAPTALRAMGYNVCFSNRLKVDCLPKSAQVKLWEKFPNFDPIDKLLQCVLDLLGHASVQTEAVSEDKEDDISRNDDEIVVSLSQIRTIRTIMFPNLLSFYKDNLMTTVLTVAFDTLTMIMTACHGERGIESLFKMVADFVIQFNLSTKHVHADCYVKRINELVRMNVEYDIQTFHSLNQVMSYDELKITPLFSVALLGALRRRELFQVYSQSSEGSKIIRALQESNIPMILEKLKVE